MELDKRIIEGKRPLTCLDIEKAREFEGKLCLFSPLLRNYKNISEYSEFPQYTGILTIRDEVEFPESGERRGLEECPFRNGNDGYFYEFALPLEWVEEEPIPPGYEPYTVMEFIEEYPLGSHLRFRPKSETMEMHRLVDGYNECKNGGGTLFLSGVMYSMTELYNDYEINRDGHWEPFGKMLNR